MTSSTRLQNFSQVLEAALQQMDGILARSSHDVSEARYTNGTDTHTDQGGTLIKVTTSRVTSLLTELKSSLQGSEDLKEKVKDMVSRDLMAFFRDWLISPGYFLSASGYLPDSVEEKVRKLEAEKESLALQVNVLTDQLEAQSEKIADLEKHVADRDNRLSQAQDMLQSEFMTRTSLESQKLDLMAELSSLSVKVADLHTHKRDLEQRYRAVQRQITELEAKLLFRDAELAELRQRFKREGSHGLTEPGDTDVERLRRAVDSLLFSNDDKDRRIDDLRRLLKRYRRVEDILVQSQGRTDVEEMLQGAEDDASSTCSFPTCSPLDTPVRDNTRNEDFQRNGLSSPSTNSTPEHHSNGKKENGNHGDIASFNVSGNARQPMGVTRSNSSENASPIIDKTSLGGQSKGISSSQKDSRRDVSEDSDVVTDAGDGLQEVDGADGQHHDFKKGKRLRQFFSKLKRSSSQNFEGGRDRIKGREFQRGGVRATTVARLADWSPRSLRAERDIPVSSWDGEQVAAWFTELDLTMYLADCRRWVTSGQQLLSASFHDLEKELGMKNALHRKKLQLALQAKVTGEEDTQLADIDHNVVARWLDDIGLPQYKDAFYDARVDGRMLHHLTVDDLLALKVSNELHHISIKRGIQVLRLCAFDLTCLRRRPSPEEQQQAVHNDPGQVMLWTCHRVMEWLRTIDLSEYAPNLRGSGVHGAIMVLEPRFNAELLAMLLSIPAAKTLLRRHLCTHFVSLIGPQTQARKRQHQASPQYQPLVVSAKVRRGKGGLFGHRRSRSDVGEEDRLICPVEHDRQGHSQETDKPTQEIGTVSKDIHNLTNMLSQEKMEDSSRSSHV